MQEGVLLAILSVAIDGGAAAVAVVALRLIQTIADAVLAGIGLLVWRSLPRGEPAGT